MDESGFQAGTPVKRSARTTGESAQPDVIDATDLMLATLHKRPFSDEAYLFELKFK